MWAGLGLGLILLALCLGGAQTAASAAGFSVLLCLVLAGALATVSRRALHNALRRHWAPILACLAFVLYALSQAWIASTATAPVLLQAAWHPLWADLVPGQGAISIAPYRTLEGLVAFFAPAAAFALGALTVCERKDRRLISTLILVAAAIFAALSLFWFWRGADGQTRLAGQFGSANAAATTLGVLALMLGARLARIAKRPNEKAMAQVPARMRMAAILFVAPLTLSVLALVLGCLLLTGSRAGIAATIGGFVLFALQLHIAGRRRQDSGFNVTAAIAILGGVLLVFGGQIVFARLLEVSNEASVRQSLFDLHWGIFLDRPLLGHGINTFHELSAHYVTPETWTNASYVGAAHNIYIQALEEGGIVGLALLFCILAPPLLRAGRAGATKSSSPEWAAAIFAATMLALAHGFVDYGFQVPAIAALIMFLLGAFSGDEIQTRTPQIDILPPDYVSSRANQAIPVHSARLRPTAARSER